MDDFLGPLTPSFLAPEHCSTPLVSCSSLGYRFLECTPTYGMKCGANASPTRDAECFPNGKAMTTIGNPVHAYKPGESCPAGWSAVSTTTYTTTEYLPPTTRFGLSPTTYFRATRVLCCPENYVHDDNGPGACVSTYKPGPQVQYFCDLDSVTLTSTITFPAPTGVRFYNPATITDSADTSSLTMYYNFADGGAIAYVSGFVGTGPWPTTTSSSSRIFGGGGYSGGGGGGGSSDLDAARVRGKTLKIAVGVAVPVGLALIAAIIFCCRKGKKKPKKTDMDTANPNLTGPNAYAKPHLSSPPPQSGQFGGAANTPYQPTSPPLTTFSNPSGNPPPEDMNGQGPIEGVGAENRESRLAQLEADKARIDGELARIRQAALEEEQRRVQAEIDGLKNQRS